ncbi:MAG: glucose-6-phosphate isomerase [Verrucomicrobia bacterium]|nr:glucose-6-phosphate isomerase [Verrucomicrobiota bacterium]
MKPSNPPFPRSVPFTAGTGVIPEATAHYQKRLSDLRGLFLDPDALEQRIREENDPICYENYGVSYSQAEGDIFFGTTVIYPGKVGLEYHLTRGHYHRKRHHAETYQALSGHGLVLFEREDGTTCTAELAPGKVTYVAPFWAHRSVNTSGVPLVFLWTCSIEAGHDYEGLGGRGMRQVVVERNGAPSVEDRPA